MHLSCLNMIICVASLQNVCTYSPSLPLKELEIEIKIEEKNVNLPRDRQLHS